jgi:hypothetical protein
VSGINFAARTNLENHATKKVRNYEVKWSNNEIEKVIKNENKKI